jgi:hypothetical protein
MNKILLTMLLSSLSFFAQAAGKSEKFTIENVQCFLSISTNDSQVTVPLNYSKGSMVGDIWSGNAIIGNKNYLVLTYGGVRIKNELMIFGVELQKEVLTSTPETSVEGSSSLIKGKIVLENDQRPAGIVLESVKFPTGEFENIIVACKINEE